jgi:ribA/ribD-fused uncharacterized protein
MDLKLAIKQHENEQERCLQILETYGVPRQRARGLASNGIEVLVTRMQREVDNASANFAAAFERAAKLQQENDDLKASEFGLLREQGELLTKIREALGVEWEPAETVNDRIPEAAVGYAETRERFRFLTDPTCHGLDTPDRVCFYEQDFYVLSNFSAFHVQMPRGMVGEHMTFDTAEEAYHFEKFPGEACSGVRFALIMAKSAHEAYKIAQEHKHLRRPNWDDIKLAVMRTILRAKVEQHEYVKRKLLATGDRELVENSWRDSFWGWGPRRDGYNMLGKLWMEVRTELRAEAL